MTFTEVCTAGKYSRRNHKADVWTFGQSVLFLKFQSYFLSAEIKKFNNYIRKSLLRAYVEGFN